MSALSDKTIRNLCEGREVGVLDIASGKASTERNLGLCLPMIEPYVGVQKRTMVVERQIDGATISDEVKILSFGQSSMGYDVRVCREGLKLFTNAHGSVIDPRKPAADCYIAPHIHKNDESLEYFLIPPNSYALAPTPEYFRIPRDVIVICLGKSTYARSGVAINVTPIEPGFEGNVVIEIANQTNLPVMIYLDQGIAQFVFIKGDDECDVSYGDRDGKYMFQTGMTLSKV